jgi:hypothetical protein
VQGGNLIPPLTENRPNVDLIGAVAPLTAPAKRSDLSIVLAASPAYLAATRLSAETRPVLVPPLRERGERSGSSRELQKYRMSLTGDHDPKHILEPAACARRTEDLG